MAYAQITYGDATFRPEDWAITEYEENADLTYTFLDGSGNPSGDLYLKTSAPFDGTSYAMAVGYVRNVAFRYDPSTQGAVSSIAMAIDVRAEAGQSLYFGLWQGGVFYKHGLVDVQAGWEWTHVERLLRAGDFVSEARNPDFSAGGAPIEFGFMVASSGAVSTAGTYDNFQVGITYEAPAQAPVANVDLAATGENLPVTIDVLANDAGESIKVLSATIPPGTTAITALPGALGTVSVVDNKIVFDPGLAFDRLAAGAQESVAIQYTIVDASGAQAGSTALVTVVGENDAPRLGGVTTASVTEDVVALPSYSVDRYFSVPAGPLLDVDAADVNRDGRIDAVVASASGFVTMLNTGNSGGLPNLQPVAVSNSGRVDGLDLADLNGDGAADLVMADSGMRTVSIALNNGTGSFGPRQSVAMVAGAPLDVTVADFNADGFADLATSNGMGGFTVLTNNRMGGFTQQRSYGGPQAFGIASGDVNGDGRSDIVLAEGTQGTVGVWLNDGYGNFFSRSTILARQREVSSVALGDVNGDGRLDLAIGDARDYSFSVMTGNGAAGFAAPRDYALDAVSGIALADVNGDGRSDVIGALAYGSGLAVRLGDGNAVAAGQLTATDADVGDRLTFALQGGSLGKYGSLSLDAAGRWTYVLNNASAAVQGLAQGQVATDLFSVAVIDASGASDQRTVAIRVTGVNDAPVVVGSDVTGAIKEPASSAGTMLESGYIAFSDADLADVHSVSVVAATGTWGTLTARVAADTTGRGTGGMATWNYSVSAPMLEQLREGQVRTESFTVNLLDGKGGVVPRTVSVALTGTNDAPVAVADQVSVQEDGKLVLAPSALLANDTDRDVGDTRKLVAVQGATHGIVALQNGSVQFTPDADYTGAASFTYTMADALGASSTATVNVLVTPVNDAPVVLQPLAGSVDALQGEPLEVSLAGTFGDVDGDALFVSAALADGGALPAWLQLQGDVLALRGTPSGVEDQLDVRVTAADAAGASATQDLRIMVGRKLMGTDDADVLTGGRGNDQIFAGNGDDRLDGGAGDDRLFDSAGVDVMTGGAGRDVFMLEAEGGLDYVTDFAVGEDRLWAAGSAVEDLQFADVDGDGTLDAQVQLSGHAVVLLGVSSLADPALLFA